MTVKKKSGSAGKKTEAPASVRKKGGKTAVSRRATTAVSPKKKKKRTVPKVRKESAVVRDVKDLISTLASAEMKYYEKVRELRAKQTKGDVMHAYNIGAQLEECKRKHPKSDADEKIREANGISKQHGRLWRLLARGFKREEITKICDMENPDTGWRIPLLTMYAISRRSNTVAGRAKYVETVLAEQLSHDRFEERFPTIEDANGKEVTVRAVTALGTIKKLATSSTNYKSVLQAYLSKDVQKDLKERKDNLPSNVRLTLNELLVQLHEDQSLLATVEEQLQDFVTSIQDEEEFEEQEA